MYSTLYDNHEVFKRERCKSLPLLDYDGILFNYDKGVEKNGIILWQKNNTLAYLVKLSYFQGWEKNGRLLLINIEKVDRKLKSVLHAFVWTFLCEMKRIRRKVKNEASNVDEPFN